jgi:hypothetical protein
VALHSPSDDNFILVVKDTGIGFPINFNLKCVKSLGLQLVNILTNQLEGSLELDRSVGTEFRIRFSETSF